ncbi:hypothetical protein TRVL_09513 [Trypanosoma vivax]|uniref:Uncharacterized protein n=1 Tax=Trypanosoma vivax (strain Y486) TaxID=1055687 RepID=G0TYX9_TRYVY|nr:hypothetical protein TRVL_09513 [Trypanosoma vivax]CCC49182.1 conserved hypothetical protein [Trypanosoma vivax Y486]
MTQVTADLEYFKCDMCDVYLHKDIFCNHRRECKGLNSTELKKSQCRQIESTLNEDLRHRLASFMPEKKSLVPVDVIERHQQARVRRNVANSYQSDVDKKIEQQLAPEKMQSLAAFLNE